MYFAQTVADLDGDGVDEVAVRGAYSEFGAVDTWLEIWRIDGPHVIDVGKGKHIPLESDGYDANDCKAQVAVEPRAGGGADLVITRELVPSKRPGPGEQKTECLVGTHRFRLHGGDLR
jgi:hypothetical protein